MRPRGKKKKKAGVGRMTGEMVLQLRSVTALAKDQSSSLGSSIRIKQLTAAYNSSSRG